MATPDLLAIENLRVEYLTARGNVCVVDDVSLRIGVGEVYGLAGESGSGKSTIAQAILRLLRPPAAITAGRVLFSGQDLLAASEDELRAIRGKSVALVTQSAMNALNPVMRVRDQIVDAILAHEAVSRARALDRAAALLELVGMGRDRLQNHPHQLSGGMRQRVVIAIALALNPRLVIMDEPTTALDVVVQQQILRRVLELRDRLGFSVLFITHDLALMTQVCARIGVLYGGRLMETAPAETLLTRARHPYTQGLLRCFLDAHQRKTRLLGIPGTPADPRSPPSGCGFHPRCGFALDVCRQTRPPLAPCGPGHENACHLAAAPAPGNAGNQQGSR
jgi:peptide/nickel transport system ATP-binding protein